MKKWCVDKTRKPLILLSDKGTKVTHVNSPKDELMVIRYDSCVIKNETAVDWILRKESHFDIFVELKGKNIEHALDQVYASMDRQKNLSDLESKRAAVIFCRQYPSGSTTINKRREKIYKSFKAKIIIRSSGREVDFKEIGF